MPVEALDNDKLLAVKTAVSFRHDDYFLHSFKEYELRRISLNFQAKVFSNDYQSNQGTKPISRYYPVC